ncbi:MAG TPA: DUF1800 family protein, partial [Bacillota bacterium]|nr:DUF1800 family protein [Bacillota bacterium]
LSLGASANRKARPGEPLARALLEQYTLGPGQFSEMDVQEVARAFTGWFVSQQELKYVDREHDPSVKTVLGQSGPFEGTDVIRILLGQPATARLVVGKLYRWFISETSPPPEPLITPLAAEFARNFDVGRLVETMLRSNLFFSPAAYRQKIKSPAEFALGIIRGLGGTVGTLRLGADLAALGQDLYAPPTVKGWAGHRYWINRFTLLNRAKLAAALLASSGPYEGKLDPAAAARQSGYPTTAAAGQFLCELFFQADLAPEVRQAVVETGETGAERLRDVAGLMAALPEFHLG